MSLDAVFQTQRKMREVEALASKSTTAAPKIRWYGTAVDFADWIFRAWCEKKIEAPTETAAFELAAEHFCQKNGQPFKKRSLQVSRRYREDVKR